MPKNRWIVVCLCLVMLAGCASPLVMGPAAVVTGKMFAEERSVGNSVDDITIATKIRESFLRRDIDRMWGAINVEVFEGVVMLTGIVESDSIKKEAVTLATAQPGVTRVYDEMRVEGELGLSAIPTYAKDSWITARVKSKMAISQDVKAINYHIETIRGVVYVLGVAQDSAELRAMKMLAMDVAGVKEVVTHVRIKKAEAPAASHRASEKHPSAEADDSLDGYDEAIEYR